MITTPPIDHLEAVRNFRIAAGLPLNQGYALSHHQVRFHEKLIQEEIDEYLEAKDPVSRMDAIVDAYYFLIGYYLHAGIYHDMGLKVIYKHHAHSPLYLINKLLSEVVNDALNEGLIFDQCFFAVHNSNMSKLANTNIEALEVQEKYLWEGVRTFIKPVGDKFAIMREDGKLLKSNSFFEPEPELERILKVYGVIREDLTLEAAKIADDEQA
jgi:hypothetical protein